MTSTLKTPEPQGRAAEPVQDILEMDRNWAERIERAREAREQGKRLREGKPLVSSFPRTLQ